MIQSDSNFLSFLKCYRIFDKKSSYYLYRQVSLFLKIKLKLMTSFVNALKIQNITKKIQKFHLKEYLHIHNSPKSDDSNHIIYSRCHEECKNKIHIHSRFSSIIFTWSPFESHYVEKLQITINH